MYSLSKLHLISRSIVSGVVAGTINGCICDFVAFIECNKFLVVYWACELFIKEIIKAFMVKPL
jgi:hypothetical protein